MEELAGIDPTALRRWLDKRVNGIKGSLRFEQIHGGHSNLTFSVRDDSQRQWVLRRPPLGQVLATAHDMARECRVITALADTGVPVPKVVGLCQDNEVSNSTFYVMDFVEGIVVRDTASADKVPVGVRKQMGHSLIMILAQLHSVDIDVVDLGDLSRREGYIERQLNRWQVQFDKSTTRELPQVRELQQLLVNNIPSQQGTGIVHGDYRLDNTIMTEKGEVAAVLDWELSTLGDVLADVAGVIAYSDERSAGGNPLPMSLEGFPSAEKICALYANESERDLSRLNFYLAFNYWRLACIVEGVYSRYAMGAMGSEIDPTIIAEFGERVLVMLDLAAEAAASEVG